MFTANTKNNWKSHDQCINSYIYLFLFFIPSIILSSSCCVWLEGNQTNNKTMIIPGVVAARLDTFGIRLVFSPILFILYILFFFIARSSYILCFFLCVGHIRKKKQRMYAWYGSRGKAWHIGDLRTAYFSILLSHNI